ncbi:NAD(P)-binding protein [Didymella exigua CBS 183.55]|uniref:NAD(P)-binding protein n=1 Tax=Didymella exigua CBS 183.55 TaxID=1150837 RepID=A0A6A5RKA1_9PLEO|nr:NAD(P)-binding protein [Didymella exigua CBS 183.55]KAF1928841.1 NAD(P)-binding protein [Didymella exigua CBS 183.55]
MAPQTPKKILIFGATGVIGKYIIQEIVNAKSSFDKIGLFTSPETAKNKPDEINGWREKGVNINVGDVNSEVDIKKAYEGYDTVVSALGRNAILTQIPLLKLAEASSSIRDFYPSEYGTDIEYGPKSSNEKPHQLKLQVRKYIRENVKKLKITYLVTGPYSDLFIAPNKDPRIGSFDPKGKKATLLGTGEEKVSFTTMRDVGRLLVAALKTPSDSSQRILRVNSFTVTGKESVGEFEKQTGSKWEVWYTPLEELSKLEEQAWEEDWPSKTPLTLRRIWTEGGTLYESRDNGKIYFDDGLETLEDQVRNTIAKHG